MKKLRYLIRPLVLVGLSAVLAGSLTATFAADKKLVVGFAQVGAESGWRTANTDSIKAEAAKRGIDLRFSDAQQKGREPDQSDPVVHRSRSGCDRVFTGGANRI